ncbi:hypothetical protein L083_3469 [Actinoplanes sp. N902-109]|nr:hypothetical protein L083_3469 [Actinoplanes sp. N902-109]
MHLSGERAQLCLACLDVPARQIPHARVDLTVRTSVDEQDPAFANQRRDDDLRHGRDSGMTV